MVFNQDGTAYSVFSSNNIKNAFKYRFVKPTIILFIDKSKAQRYYIQKLTASHFQFIKYPVNYNSEEISIIEAIDFQKK